MMAMSTERKRSGPLIWVFAIVHITWLSAPLPGTEADEPPAMLASSSAKAAGHRSRSKFHGNMLSDRKGHQFFARDDLPSHETRFRSETTSHIPAADKLPGFATTPLQAGVILATQLQQRSQGELLLVWLLDSSHSTAENRNEIAEGIEALYQRFDVSTADHRVMSAAVSYGSSMRELVEPTDSVSRILSAVRRLKVDESGTESTFAMIEKCAAKYGRTWPERDVVIITWTDESGDDTARLEDTIRVCRDNHVSVMVAGPMAVLGGSDTTEPFVDRFIGETHRLPVNRGPDSPVPMQLELGYWFLTQRPDQRQVGERGFMLEGLPSWFGSGNREFGDHRCIAATEVDLPIWHGNRDLDGLVSGFGPYALTRLANETGGAYIIVADDDHTGPFRPAMMAQYAPDYRNVDEYQQDVLTNPLRLAVTKAIKELQRDRVTVPPTLLFGQRSQAPPYGFMRDYYTPTRFANKVKMISRRITTQTQRSSDTVEQALAHVSAPDTLEVGLELEYAQEPSRRWRAWYDLTRGRLLATSVRLEEYRRTYRRLTGPGTLDQDTNFAVLVPSTTISSGSIFRHRAEEAERLLLRCVRENPNTPWALLAQRELDYGLGIEVKQFTTHLVVMPSVTNSQRVVFPNL